MNRLPDEPVVRWNEQPSCGYVSVSLKCDIRLIGGKDARLKDEGDSADVLLESSAMNKQPKREQEEEEETEAEQESEEWKREAVDVRAEMVDQNNNKSVESEDFVREFQQKEGEGGEQDDEWTTVSACNRRRHSHHHHHHMYRNEYYNHHDHRMEVVYMDRPREWLVEQRGDDDDGGGGGQLQFQVLQTREQMQHQLWLREQQAQEQLLQDQLAWDLQQQQQQQQETEEQMEQQHEQPTVMQEWQHDVGQGNNMSQLAGEQIKVEDGDEEDDDSQHQLPQLSVEAVKEVLDDHSSIAEEDGNDRDNEDIMEGIDQDEEGSLHVDFASLRQLLLRDPRIESVVLVIRDQKTNDRNTITIM